MGADSHVSDASEEDDEDCFVQAIQVRGPPRLKPEEGTQRASQIAVDMCVMNVQYLNTLSQFLPFNELFHVEMQLLYGLIDTMGATANIDKRTVLQMVDKYFKSLRVDENEIKGTRRHGEFAAYLERKKHRK